MSETVNFFESPKTVAVPENGYGEQGILTEVMLSHLKRSAPWLKFVSVLGFIGAGLLVAWGIVRLNAWDLVFSGIEVESQVRLLYRLEGILYFGAGIILFFSAFFMHRFGVKISLYMRTGMDRDLERALQNNASLWKFTGIAMIVYIGIPLLAIVIILIAYKSSGSF
jgi:hypothetical protein